MKKPEETLSKYIFDSDSIDGLSYDDAILCMTEHAEQNAIEFANYLLTGYIIVAPWFQRCWKSGKDAKTYSTNQLYEQFMIERSRRTQKE